MPNVPRLPMKLSEDPRFEAARAIKEWSTWMVTTEGVLIGFLVNALAKMGAPGAALGLNQGFIVWTVVAFAISIAMAGWVLGNLPSIMQRLPRSRLALGAHGIFDLPFVRWIPLYALTFLQHLFFGVGLVTLFLALPLDMPVNAPQLKMSGSTAWNIGGAAALVALLLAQAWRRHVRRGGAHWY